MLHRFALHNNVWNGIYLISKYKDQEHVFLWYKNLYQNAPFQTFFRECSEQAKKINICVEPMWAKKLFNRIRTVCYSTKFFQDLFWIMKSNEPNNESIIVEGINLPRDYLDSVKFFFQMKCLLGSLHFLHAQETLHYHFIREDDVHFQNLFERNTLDKTCTLCCITFDSARNKKKHTFFFHYLQTGGRGGNPGMSDLPLNVLRRPLVTYYFNNFEQHKNF